MLVFEAIARFTSIDTLSHSLVEEHAATIRPHLPQGRLGAAGFKRGVSLQGSGRRVSPKDT